MDEGQQFGISNEEHRPLPDPDLERDVRAQIANAARQAKLSLKEFWDCFSGGDSALTRWAKEGKLDFTDKLIGMFEPNRINATFKDNQTATWEQLAGPLADGAHLLTRLGSYRSRLVEWERAELDRKLADRANEGKLRSAELALPITPLAISPVDPPNALHVVVEDLQWMSLVDFEPGSMEALKEDGWRFICGETPNPVTALHAAVRREEVGTALISCSEPRRIVILHGPVGEGASTAVLQAAHEAVKVNRPVLRLRRVSDLIRATLLIASAQQPLVIIEDANELNEAPSWIDRFLGVGGTLLLGTQTRHLHRLAPLFDPRVVRTISLHAVDRRDADAFIKNIERFAPSPDPKRSDRFLEGLSIGHGLGGLWPAQYQATRGEALDHKVKLVVEQFDHGLLPMLSALIFSGWIHDYEPRLVPKPLRSQVLSFYALMDLKSELKVQADDRLTQVIRALDGEFFAFRPWTVLSSANDPSLALRHPAVTESLFRWLFGARDANRGRFAYDKWEYFITAVRQAAGADDGDAAYALVRLVERAYRHDFERSGELKHHLLGPMSPKRGDVLLLAVDQAYPVASDHQRRRLDMMRARVWAGGQWGRPADENEQARALERATAVIASAWGDKDFSAISQAAVVLDRLRAQYVADVNTYTPMELFNVAERWERPTAGRPSTVAFNRLKLLATGIPYRAELISAAANNSLFLSWPGWNEERLEVLRRLISIARAGKRGQRLRMGLPTDSFGLSLRSLYAGFLLELARVYEQLSFKGNSALIKPSNYLHNMVFSILREWANDEDECDDVGWPEGLVDSVVDTVERQMQGASLPNLLGYAARFGVSQLADSERLGTSR